MRCALAEGGGEAADAGQRVKHNAIPRFSFMTRCTSFRPLFPGGDLILHAAHLRISQRYATLCPLGLSTRFRRELHV